jgi:signal transduction histidine kinase/HAMP domain-containing protein
MSLRAKIIIAVLAAVIVTEVLAAWAVNDRILAGARREADSQTHAQAAQIRALYEQRAETLVAQGEAVSLYPAVISALADGKAAPLIKWSGQVAARQNTKVTVTDAAGKVIARGHDPKKGDNLIRLEGLRLALDGQKVSGVEQGDELSFALRGYAPVSQDGKVVGAVMIAEPLDQLLEKLTRNGQATAKMQVGSVPLAQGCDTPAGAAAACRFWLASPSGLPSATLELSVPLLEIEQARKDTQHRLWIIGGLVLGISALVAWVLAHSLTRPLARLTVSAHRIASGTYDQPAGVTSNHDEIGVLARAFEIMREQVAKATTALRDERDVLDAVLESVEAGILMTDTDGRAVIANGRWAELLGGKDLLAAGHLTGADGRVGSFAEAARDWLANKGQEAQEDFEQGEPLYRRFRCYTAPVHHQNANEVGGGSIQAIGRIFVIRDVTQESEAERMRSALVATVSHELRSPLTAIKGYTDTLLQGGPWNAETEREFLGIVATSAEKLSGLVDNLLDAAQLEAGVLNLHQEPARVERIAQQVVRQRQPLTLDHQLQVEVSPHLPLAEADPVRVEQVITNLVDNAIKYSPEGGLITIRVVEDEETVIVSVSDCGIGIAPEHLEHLFERFYRAESDSTAKIKGLGLGLYICKGLVEAHGGHMWVESQLGVGSTFFITLPKLADTERNAEGTALPHHNIGKEVEV